MTPTWCKPKHSKWRWQGESLQKHVHDPTLDAPCAHLNAFLDNTQDKEALTKCSYLHINVTEVSVGRASCRVSTFPFRGKDFYFEWGQARWSFVPGSGATWQCSPRLLPQRTCEVLSPHVSGQPGLKWKNLCTQQPELDTLSGAACVLMPGEIWQVNVCFKFLFNHSYSFNFEV